MDFQTVLELRRSLVDARARASQRGRQHWSAAFPRLEAWILSKPVSTSGSGPASEISSQAGEDDFEDNLLVSTPNKQFEQVLLVQAQKKGYGHYGTQYGHFGTQYGTPAVSRAKHNGTLCSYLCAIGSSGHAQCQSRS